MAQQTPIEWLKDKLQECGSPGQLSIDWDEFDAVIEQAKKMERSHLEYAYNKGYDDGWCIGKHDTMEEDISCSGENFYYETYKDEDIQGIRSI